MLKLIVNLDEMQQQINRMTEMNDDYRHTYGSLLNRIDESSLYWKGKDHDVFLRKIHDFEDDFDQLYQLLRQYIDFLEKSLQAYRLCQDQAEQNSLRM